MTEANFKFTLYISTHSLIVPHAGSSKQIKEGIISYKPAIELKDFIKNVLYKTIGVPLNSKLDAAALMADYEQKTNVSFTMMSNITNADTLPDDFNDFVETRKAFAIAAVNPGEEMPEQDENDVYLPVYEIGDDYIAFMYPIVNLLITPDGKHVEPSRKKKQEKKSGN